jgi:hypothetical protein
MRRQPDVWEIVGHGDLEALKAYVRDGKSPNRTDRVRTLTLGSLFVLLEGDFSRFVALFLEYLDFAFAAFQCRPL